MLNYFIFLSSIDVSFLNIISQLNIRVAKKLDPDQASHSV